MIPRDQGEGGRVTQRLTFPKQNETRHSHRTDGSDTLKLPSRARAARAIKVCTLAKDGIVTTVDRPAKARAFAQMACRLIVTDP